MKPHPTLRKKVPATVRSRVSARERLGRIVARRLDDVFVLEMLAKRYNPAAFLTLLEEFLAQTDDHWERLEIRRRCAGRQFSLAYDHRRGLRELTRLHTQRAALGYSSLSDECGHLGLYARALADRGKTKEAHALLLEFAGRVSKVHRESAYMRKELAKMTKAL